MEGEVCQYNKFGYCRYKKDCKRIHFTSECNNLPKCKNVQNCNKRHPKGCKRLAGGSCRFGTDCAYNHQEQPKMHTQCANNEKVTVLENKLKEMSMKITILETELKVIKENKNIRENLEVKEKKYYIEIDGYSEAPTKSSTTFKCIKCDYVSKTDVSLKKHVNTKHAPKKDKPSNKEAYETQDIDGVEDLFQIEIVDGKQLYACMCAMKGLKRITISRNI